MQYRIHPISSQWWMYTHMPRCLSTSGQQTNGARCMTTMEYPRPIPLELSLDMGCVTGQEWDCKYPITVKTNRAIVKLNHEEMDPGKGIILLNSVIKM
eukprot:10834729-Ditylum_brightwellii.AAC.3